jgi:dehydrogenase/reductase SDR family member 4
MQSLKRNLHRLDGKVAVITAASEGQAFIFPFKFCAILILRLRIGFAIAQRLGHEGAKIVISSRNEENVKKAVEKLVSDGLEPKNVCGYLLNKLKEKRKIRPSPKLHLPCGN